MEDRAFQAGDPVVLALGPNWGTQGTFVALRADPKWADLTEKNNVTRSHPVAWLQHGDVPRAGTFLPSSD
jgi:hypothetical protein